MSTYIIYFEIFGRKLKTFINADNEEQAKYKLYNKIIFHKIEKQPPVNTIDLDELKSFLGMK